jgi:hypothetical protein
VDVSALDGVRPSGTEPTLAAERFTSDLRSRLAISSERRMDVAAALVVTKCDALLAERSVPHPYERLASEATDRQARSAAVRDWLREVGVEPIVTHLTTSYRRTSFFAVSALDLFGRAVRTSARTAAEVRNDDPAAPVRWLLNPREVR